MAFFCPFHRHSFRILFMLNFFYHSLLEFSSIFFIMVFRNKMEIESKVDRYCLFFYFLLFFIVFSLVVAPMNYLMVELNMNIFPLIRFVHILFFFISFVFSDRTWVSTSSHRYIPQKNCPINNSNSRNFFPRLSLGDCHFRIVAVSLLLWRDRHAICSSIFLLLNFFTVEFTLWLKRMRSAFSIHTTFWYIQHYVQHINENWNEMRHQCMNLARMNWT